ncbi:MAG: hypothetical protein DMF06_11245 [Verrucomicrobia bacterium]|nr:MAG: hypothetical protein DMF06_11245 [Verrucomicrobiota bacterium]
MRDGETLFDFLWQHGPLEFSRSRLARVDDLFSQRNALFYTPSANLPLRWTGSGTVVVTLPIVTPTFYEARELRYQQFPRMWVDLLQRATGKLRWQPMNPARVTIRRYDTRHYRHDVAVAGVKALLDALKVRTSGRRDGRYLHYFGAIVDDGDGFISQFGFEQVLIRQVSEARTEVRVEPASEDNP